LTDGITVSPSRQTITVRSTDDLGVAKTSLVIDGKEVAAVYNKYLSWNWGTRPVALGAHTITVHVTNTSGNVTSKTVTVYR
jgi:hypothetical protein